MLKSEDFLNSFGYIPEEVFNKLKKISQYKRIDANTQVDKLGKIPSKIYLVISGVMRCYVTSESGKEFNKRFFFSMDFAGSLTALIRKAPSEIVYETLTECEVYEIDFTAMNKLCEENIIISNLYTRILEKVFMRYEKRQLELISMNASQRYKKLKKDIPNIDKLVPQYHIASYLSITPVQLSRIRKKLKQQFN